MFRLWLLAFSVPLLLARPSAPLTRAQQEEFLRTAKVVANQHLKTGVTSAQRLTLEKDGFRHDAHFQSIDLFKETYDTPRGREHNFKDSYKFNLAAYGLALLLGLDDMIPVSVERRVHGASGALTWWIDDVLMDETARLAKHIDPPDVQSWHWQMGIVRTFDQLIANIDRNLGNLLIDKNWHAWMIDHTRAFRMEKQVRDARNLTHCDREMMARMRALDRSVIKERLGRYLTGFEIDGLLARRDQIVALFEALAKEKGEAAVFDDRPQKR